MRDTLNRRFDDPPAGFWPRNSGNMIFMITLASACYLMAASLIGG